MLKKAIATATLLGSAFLLAGPVGAANVTRPSIKDQIKDQVIKRMARIVIGQGKIEAKGNSSLTVSENGKTYTVNIETMTVLRRKFGAKSTLDEMSVGDLVNVVGRFTDDTQTTITAKLIRDLSIQKRNATFVGEIKSLTTDGFVMSTVSESRADQTVTLSSSTKFVNIRGQQISKSDLQVGQRVMVKGLWNNTNNTVTEVTIVKDYSLGTPKK